MTEDKLDDREKLDELLLHEPSDMRPLLKKILTSITPTQRENEAIQNIVIELTESCQKLASEDNIPLVDIVHVGSSSRGTHLRGDTDVDLFLRFQCQSKKEIKSFLERIAKRLEEVLYVRVTWKYSENPYLHFSMTKDNITFFIDIVGTVYIKDPTDLPWALTFGGMARTPFHSWYLSRKLNSQLKASVRLFKYWLKLKKCYGTGGITGFLSELLIIHFQSFMKCLEFLAKNTLDGFYLDLERHHASISELKKKFPHDCCVIVDPIDPNRNVAAGIQGFYSRFVMMRLQQEARKSILNPREDLQREVNAKAGWIKIHADFQKKPNNEDEQFLIMARIARMITAQLDNRGFSLQDVLIDAKSSNLFLKFTANHVPYFKRRGPPLDKPEEVKKFKEKNHDTFEQDGRIWARVKNTPPDVITWLKINSQNVQKILPVRLTIHVNR